MRTLGVVYVGTPEAYGEEDSKEAEEEAGELEPEDAADAAEGFDEAGDAAASGAGSLAGDAAVLEAAVLSGRCRGCGSGVCGALRRPGRSRAVGVACRAGWGSWLIGTLFGAFLCALFGDASSDAHSYAESAANLFRLHAAFSLLAASAAARCGFVRMKGNAGQNVESEAWERLLLSAMELPERRVGSKVERC